MNPIQNIEYETCRNMFQAVESISDTSRNIHQSQIQIMLGHSFSRMIDNYIHTNGWHVGFEQACRFGDFELVQWMYSRNEGIIQRILDDEDEINHLLFISVCRRGHLDIARWLHSFEDFNAILNDDIFNIAFIHCAERGRLEVMEWLYSLGCIDISRNDYEVYTLAEENEQTEVVDWLTDIFQVMVLNHLLIT
jgi:hypothetical protein